MILSVASLLLVAPAVQGCSDYIMRFKEENFKLSGRTMDLGATNNWTISSWPAEVENGFSSHDEDIPSSFRWTSKYNSVGISGNWFGDEEKLHTSLFGDALNDQGLSCSMQTLVDTQYEPYDIHKKNIFYGTFCQYAAQMYATVAEAADSMESITIYGPNFSSENHYILHDATGASLMIELVGGEKHLYLDLNDDGETGFGIMTNEPQLSYHLTNVEHYEWKRSLARQAVAVPGGWYPEERFLRIHMVKAGMEQSGDVDTTDFQQAFSLTTQVLNTVTVPMGLQYGTDTEASGKGSSADHTMWGIVRDHKDPTIYWRDSYNPTFRRLRLKDIDFQNAPQQMLVLESGPYFIDMADKMVPLQQ